MQKSTKKKKPEVVRIESLSDILSSDNPLMSAVHALLDAKQAELDKKNNALTSPDE